MLRGKLLYKFSDYTQKPFINIILGEAAISAAFPVFIDKRVEKAYN